MTYKSIRYNYIGQTFSAQDVLCCSSRTHTTRPLAEVLQPLDKGKSLSAEKRERADTDDLNHHKPLQQYRVMSVYPLRNKHVLS